MNKTGNEIFYVVGRIKQEMEVTSNLPYKIAAVKLHWAEGQVGALPVFKIFAAASEYAGGEPVITVVLTGVALSEGKEE